MRIILYCLAVSWGLIGFVIFAGAKTAVHEIEGMMCMRIATISLSSAGISGAIRHYAGHRAVWWDYKEGEKPDGKVERPPPSFEGKALL